MQSDVLRRQRRRIAFQQDAQIEYLLNFASIQQRHAGRAVRQRFECAFGDQSLERLSNRRIADDQALGEAAQRDDFPWLETARQYRLLERRIGARIIRLAPRGSAVTPPASACRCGFEIRFRLLHALPRVDGHAVPAARPLLGTAQWPLLRAKASSKCTELLHPTPLI